jgi:molybdate transport system substrate-binding protein
MVREESAMKRIAARLLMTAAFAVAGAYSASAAELSLVAPGGIRAALEDLVKKYQAQTGNTVKETYGSGGGTKARVIKGEAFDVPVVQLPLEPVVSSGNVVITSETPLAHVAVGIAVRTGQPHPDISTADAVKKLLLNAKYISYPSAAAGAAAGVSFDETLKKLGIADEMKPKIKAAQGGRGAMELLAKGEVDIGLTFISEIITEPGVETVGPLPRDISTPTQLIGYVGAHSKDPANAKALLAFLSGPEAAAVYKARGMEPGR